MYSQPVGGKVEERKHKRDGGVIVQQQQATADRSPAEQGRLQLGSDRVAALGFGCTLLELVLQPKSYLVGGRTFGRVCVGGAELFSVFA